MTSSRCPFWIWIAGLNQQNGTANPFIISVNFWTENKTRKIKKLKDCELICEALLGYHDNTPPITELQGRHKTSEDLIILSFAWPIFCSLFIREMTERNKKLAWLYSLPFPNTRQKPWKPQLLVKEWSKWRCCLRCWINYCFQTLRHNIYLLWWAFI